MSCLVPCCVWPELLLTPLSGFAGSVPQKRKVDRAVRDFAWLAGLATLWTGGWQALPDVSVTRHDLALWLYSAGSLVKIVSFLINRDWPF